MANKARGEVTLELGGESYVLVPSFGAVCEIEDKIGANLFNLGRRLELAEMSARELADFAHACLAQAGYRVDKARLGESIVEAGAYNTVAALIRFCREGLLDGLADRRGAQARAAAAGAAAGAMNGVNLSGTP